MSRAIPITTIANSQTFYRLYGNSMWPLIRDGDKISIAPLKSAPRLGTPLVFVNQNRLVCHRLHEIRHEPNGVRFILRGDAFFVPDRPVTESEIIGTLHEIQNAPIRSWFCIQNATTLANWFHFRDALLARARLRRGTKAFHLVFLMLTPWLAFSKSRSRKLGSKRV